MILDNVVWGFIGCGSVTEKKSGPALANTPGSRVAAVMRRNAALAEDYARRHAIPRWYADADALIADPEVNAIYVATPPSTHMHYALQAIAAGKPVYIEKPMAMDHAECERVLEASARSGVPVFVAGMIGWDTEGRFPSATLAGQARKALENFEKSMKSELDGQHREKDPGWNNESLREEIAARAAQSTPAAPEVAAVKPP